MTYPVAIHENSASAVVSLMSLEPIRPQEGMEATQEIRDQFGVDESQNVAYAEVEIDGWQDELVAISGLDFVAGTIAARKNRHFQTFETPPGHNRAYDSEVKLLEEIARLSTAKSKGAIRLFTESKPCPSCEDVIAQFQSDYPGIQIVISHG